jgi:hypothetical protein
LSGQLSNTWRQAGQPKSRDWLPSIHADLGEDFPWDFFDDMDMQTLTVRTTADDKSPTDRFTPGNVLVPRLGKITIGTPHLPACWLLCEHDLSKDR